MPEPGSHLVRLAGRPARRDGRRRGCEPPNAGRQISQWLVPEQRITVAEAVEAYTLRSASRPFRRRSRVDPPASWPTSWSCRGTSSPGRARPDRRGPGRNDNRRRARGLRGEVTVFPQRDVNRRCLVMSTESPSSPRMVSTEFTLAGDNFRMTSRVAVPAGPTTVTDLLPLARALADAVVHETCKGVEQSGQKISCKKGCGKCCDSLVAISEVEARRIRVVVEQLPSPRRADARPFAEARERLDRAGLLDRLVSADKWTEEDYQEMVGTYFAGSRARSWRRGRARSTRSGRSPAGNTWSRHRLSSARTPLRTASIACGCRSRCSTRWPGGRCRRWSTCTNAGAADPGSDGRRPDDPARSPGPISCGTARSPEQARSAGESEPGVETSRRAMPRPGLDVPPRPGRRARG